MRRRNEFEKSPSLSPRFSRTFDLLLSRFPDSTSSSIMASNRGAPDHKPTQWRATVSAPLCASCNKRVYPAEEVNGAGQKFHKLCLKCASCNTLLNPGNLNERDKKIYCVTCYGRQFGPRGLGRGLANSYVSNLETPPNSPHSNQDEIDSNSGIINTDDSSFHSKISTNSPLDDDSHYTNTQNTMNSSMPYYSGVTTRQTIPNTNRSTSTSVINGSAFKRMSISGNICPRCSKTVYSAEEVKAAGKSFHKQCYNCAHCKGSLSSGRYSERNGELYDNNCYQRLFGPRGVGFGIGAGALSTGN